jgi:hypothetical protein
MKRSINISLGKGTTHSLFKVYSREDFGGIRKKTIKKPTLLGLN